MFPNLRAEMARIGIDGKVISSEIGMSEKSFSHKLNGKSEFTRSELFKIRDKFFPRHKIEYLFSEEPQIA